MRALIGIALATLLMGGCTPLILAIASATEGPRDQAVVAPPAPGSTDGER